jgi:hypothetical protein
MCYCLASPRLPRVSPLSPSAPLSRAPSCARPHEYSYSSLRGTSNDLQSQEAAQQQQQQHRPRRRRPPPKPPPKRHPHRQRKRRRKSGQNLLSLRPRSPPQSSRAAPASVPRPRRKRKSRLGRSWLRPSPPRRHRGWTKTVIGAAWSDHEQRCGGRPRFRPTRPSRTRDRRLNRTPFVPPA